jgi:hypothetical protein
VRIGSRVASTTVKAKQAMKNMYSGERKNMHSGERKAKQAVVRSLTCRCASGGVLCVFV